MKRKRQTKNERIVVKVTLERKKEILRMADKATEGNVSRLMLWGVNEIKRKIQ